MVKLIFSTSYIDEYKYGLNLRKKEADCLAHKSVVIVPQHMTLQAELEIMELLNCRGLFDLDVMNINRFIGKFSPERPILDDIGQVLILLNIIHRNRKKLNLYSKSAKNLGFIENLSALIHELRSNFIEPENIDRIQEELQEEFKLLKHKLSEIYLIYSEYCRYMSEQLYDEGRLIRDFISMIPNIKELRDTVICVEGFSDLDNSHLNMLAHLSNHVKELQIRLVGADENTPMYHHIERFKNRILEIFHSHDIDVQLIYAKGEANGFCKDMQSIFTGAQHLLNEPLLDAGNDASKEKEDHIRLIQSLTPKDEIRNIVYQIVMECKRRDCKLNEFAILSENISECEHMIKDVCRMFKIPYFVSTKTPLINHHYADFILSALRVILSGYRGDEVIKFLKNKFVGMGDKAIAIIKNDVRQYDLKYAYRWKKFMMESQEHSMSAEDQNRFSSCMNAIMDLERKFNASEDVLSFIQALRELISHFSIEEKLMKMADEAQEKGDLAYAQELSQIFSLIEKIFLQISVISEFELSARNLYDLLFFAFSSIKISVLPQNPESLFFGNIKSNKLSRLKKLYVINMSEGVIPARQDEGGIFSFAERDVLIKYHFLNMKDYSYEYNLSTYNLYENMHGISEAVYWSHPLLLNHEPNLPSIWYGALVELGFQTRYLELTPHQISSGGISLLYFDYLLNRLLEHEELGPEEYSHLHSFLQEEQFGQKFYAVLEGLTYTNIAKIEQTKISSEQMYGKEFDVSISRLEKFAKCPYQHFVDYVLKPKVPQEHFFTSLDIGNIFHYIFENIMNELSHLDVASFSQEEMESLMSGESISSSAQDADKLSSSDIWDRAFEKHYAKLLEENPKFALNAKNLFFANRFKEILKNAVKYNIIQLKLTKFKNIYNELAVFQGTGTNVINSLELVNDEFKKISIIGKIDRVDLAEIDRELEKNPQEHYFRVIDYKTGASEFNQKLFEAGLSLQLPIYLNMVLNSEKMKEMGAKAYGAFYFVIPGEIFLETKSNRDILSEFSLNGIFLEDQGVNNQLDLSISSNDGKSLISPYEQEPKSRSKASKLMLSDEAMEELLKRSKEKALELAVSIYEKEISISPVGNLPTYSPCEYCKYIDICKFDTSDEKQDYRYIK